MAERLSRTVSKTKPSMKHFDKEELLKAIYYGCAGAFGTNLAQGNYIHCCVFTIASIILLIIRYKPCHANKNM
jgi:hypothetical protein